MPLEVRVESNAVGSIDRNHLADSRVAVLAEEVDIDDDLFLGRHRIVELRQRGRDRPRQLPRRERAL